MTRLAQALASLSGRERGLLAALVLVALPAGLWLGLAEPLLERRDRARAALAEARALDLRVRQLADDLAALPALADAARIAPEGAGGIEARLQAAGLTEADLGAPVRLTDAGEGALALGFEQVEFTALMAWVASVEAEAGYRLAGLRLHPLGQAGLVEASLRLEARP